MKKVAVLRAHKIQIIENYTSAACAAVPVPHSVPL